MLFVALSRVNACAAVFGREYSGAAEKDFRPNSIAANAAGQPDVKSTHARHLPLIITRPA
jgi:hypothetical protein